jgi:ketosteroid isomerase-like protein
VKKRYVVLLCVAVAGVALAIMFTRTSDEDRIRQLLRDFAKVVAVKDGDTLLSRGARVKGGMKDLVDDDVRVNIAELSVDVRGRAKLEEDAMRVGLLYQKADCEFSSLSIKVDQGGTVATVDAAAIVTATGRSGGERRVDKRDVHFLLRKDANWKIATIDVAATAAAP